MATIWLRLLVLFASVVGANSAAAQTTITFEEFPQATEVRNQYAAKGVHFGGQTIFSNSAPHSGKNVLYSVPPNIEAFIFPGPIRMDFDGGQSSVSLFAGTAFSQAESGTLTAFDAAGNVLMRDGPRSVPPGAFKTRFEVHAATKVIRRVELLYADDHNEVFDDLTFTGSTGGGLPKDPPTVSISSPKPGAQTSATTFLVEGTVTGPQVNPHAVLTLHVQRPVGSTIVSDFTFPITLVDRGPANVRFFSQTVSLGVGPNTITMNAENSAGLKGKATAVVDALPDLIRARLRQEGGTAALGAFAFGSVTLTDPCPYAVYARAAISASAGTTSVVRGAVLQKWLALSDSKIPRLGCSRGEERTVGGTARAQDFTKGRIYSSPAGNFFVPPVFTAAIDILGGEAGVGVPNSDPTNDSRPAFNTWLFQRFVRTGIPVASTLEIRGDPPRLFVERQGGDLSLFTGVLRPTNPVIVESFTCTTTAGPCQVTAPQVQPLFTGAGALCHNKEFDWKEQVKGLGSFNPDPPEWVPIRGNFIPVPIWGVLFDVHLARGDNPFTHRNKFDPCPAPVLEALVNELICPSDWDLKIRPLPGFGSMQPIHRDAVQIEFERVDFQHQLVKYGDPTPGDLIFAAGRFVVDCGHGGSNLNAFKTEIHPPSVYTAVKMVTRNGRPSTQADIWVNLFFSGGDSPQDAVEFDIFPPPRPNPQALIGALTPGDQNQAVKVTFKSLGPFGPMRVRVTATRRTPEITKAGEMKPRKETVPFGFDGRLQVFWSCPGGPC